MINNAFLELFAIIFIACCIVIALVKLSDYFCIEKKKDVVSEKDMKEYKRLFKIK